MDKRIIARAIRNGWDGSGYRDYYSTIFNHEFAKAFWGEDIYCYESNGFISECTLAECEKAFAEDGYVDEYMPLWQYMLKEMVLEEDPLEFLAQFLEDDVL